MGRCRRHPQHAVVGICAHCLNDRLLVLLEEEEDQELMLSGLYQMSPNSNFTCKPSPSTLLAGSPYMPRYGNTRAGLHIAPYGYDRTDVSHIAASYMSKHNLHHSLSSSPQFHSIKPPTSNAKSSQRIPHGAHNLMNPFISDEATRKKRSSLWSILLGHRDDNGSGIKQAQCHIESHIGDELHAWKEGREGRPKVRHAGARAEINGRRVDDGFACPSKSSCSSSRREAHDRLCRGEYASSLMSSPHFMASPSRVQGQNHRHFPSPVSKFVPTGPLQKERFGNEEKASPTRRQAQGVYGLPTHTASHSQEDESSRASWISSFFPGRNRRSRSISGTDAMMFSQPTHVYSVAASPNSAPKGKRKSLSFLDDATKVSTNAGTLFDKSINDVRINSPELRVRGYKYDDYSGLQALDNEYHTGKHSRACRKGRFHSVLGDHAKDEEHTLSVEGSLNASAVYSSTSPHALKSEAILALKSPRAKLANFLIKRKTGTVSIDCGRDVRVSPMPMLKVKRDNLSHQELLDKQGCKPNQSLRSLEQMTSYAEPYGDAFKHEPAKGFMVESMPNVEKDVPKSPRLMSLQAMKQLLKSPKQLAPVRTSKKGTGDEEYGEQHSVSTRSSWSKAFSKTLSPMLGRKQKKKQGIKRQDFVYDGYVHTQKYGHSDRHHNNEPVIMSDTEAQHQGHHHHGNPRAAEKYGLYHHHHHVSRTGDKGDELLVRETHMLPALDEKGPPQQYSFLSKDYSAFSFYFSPKRPDESVSNASKRSSVW